MIYESVALELISEKNDSIFMRICCFLGEEKGYKRFKQMFLTKRDELDVFIVCLTFKQVADKSGTAFVNDHLVKEFTENTESGRVFETFYAEPYQDRYVLDCLGDGGCDFDAKYNLGFITMKFSFVDCEVGVKKIRDGKNWLENPE